MGGFDLLRDGGKAHLARLRLRLGVGITGRRRLGRHLDGRLETWREDNSSMQSQNTEMPEMPIAPRAPRGQVSQDIPDSIELAVGVEHSAVSDVILIDDQLGNSGGTHAPHRTEVKFHERCWKNVMRWVFFVSVLHD